MDTVGSVRRSEIMRAVKGSGTKPEIALRWALVRDGLWPEAQARDLPGRPDLVFRGSKVAVFLDGCFWHGHAPCYRAPSSNCRFWAKKLDMNIRRDRRIRRRLRGMGWSAVTVWECRTNTSMKTVVGRIKGILSSRIGG